MIRGHANLLSGAAFVDNAAAALSAVVTGMPAADFLGRPLLAEGASVTILTDRPSAVLVMAADVDNHGSGGYWLDQSGSGSTTFTAAEALRLLSVEVMPPMSVAEKNDYMEQAHPLRTRPAAYGHTFGFAIDPSGYSISRPSSNDSLRIATNRQDYAIHHLKNGEVFIQDPTYGNTNQRSERIDYSHLLPFDTDCWWAFWWRVADNPVLEAAGRFAICGQVFGTADAGETFPRGPILRNLIYRQDDGSLTYGQVTTYDTAATSTTASPLVTRWEVPLVAGVWHYQISKFRLSRSGGGYLKTWLDGAVKFDGSIPLGFNDTLGPHLQQGIYKAVGATDDIEIRFANIRYTTDDLSAYTTSPPPIS